MRGVVARRLVVVWTTAAIILAALGNEVVRPESVLAVRPGGAGAIAFESNGDIWTVQPDGSGLAQRTNTAERDTSPSWSGDGSRLAFARGFALEIMSASNSAVTPAAGAPALDFPRVAWAPDDTVIALLTNYPDGGEIGFYDLATGSTQELLPPIPHVCINVPFPCGTDPVGLPALDMAWAPDGDRLVYTGRYPLIDDLFGVWVVDRDAVAEPTPVCMADPSSMPRFDAVTCPEGIGAEHPSWSPDGSRIIFEKSHSPTDPGEVYSINVDGSGLQQVTVALGDENQPTWSPDNATIAFTVTDALYVRHSDASYQQITPFMLSYDPDWQCLGPTCLLPPDTDGDDILDPVDNCPNDWNADQADTDGDGIGDVCDFDDSDGDGVSDLFDNCPDTPNPDQADTDGDGIGDACQGVVDGDGDGIPDASDNCPTTPNPDQADADGDGTGDACEQPAGLCGQDGFTQGHFSTLTALAELNLPILSDPDIATWDTFVRWCDDGTNVRVPNTTFVSGSGQVEASLLLETLDQVFDAHLEWNSDLASVSVTPDGPSVTVDVNGDLDFCLNYTQLAIDWLPLTKAISKVEDGLEKIAVNYGKGKKYEGIEDAGEAARDLVLKAFDHLDKDINQVLGHYLKPIGGGDLVERIANSVVSQLQGIVVHFLGDLLTMPPTSWASTFSAIWNASLCEPWWTPTVEYLLTPDGATAAVFGYSSILKVSTKESSL